VFRYQEALQNRNLAKPPLIQYSKMIKGCSISLILSYVILLAAPLAPYVEYVINKEHIKTHHCEERHIPESECEGVCYLNKQLQNHNHQHKDAEVIVHTIFQIGFLNSMQNDLNLPPDVKELSQKLHPSTLLSGISFGVYKPPRL